MVTTASSNNNEDYIKWNTHLPQRVGETVTFLEPMNNTADYPLNEDDMPEQEEPRTSLPSSVDVVKPTLETPRPKKEKDKEKPPENKVVRLLEKNPLGMTLPEMAGGPRQVKKMKTLRPMLAEAIRQGLVMPISQRAGSTVYQLVKHKNLGLR